MDVLFVDKQAILATTAQMPSVMMVMNLATLHKIAPARFLPQEHHTTKTNLVQSINILTPKGTGHTPPIKVPDMGDISAGQSPTTIPTMTETAVSEGTPSTPHPATMADCTAFQPMDASITHSCHDTNQHSCSPSSTCHFSNRHHSCHSRPRVGLASATSTALHRKIQPRKAKQHLRPSTPHKPYHSKTVTIPDLPSYSSSDSDNSCDPLNY